MKKLLILTAVFVLAFGTANAVTIGLHSSNAGIGTMKHLYLGRLGCGRPWLSPDGRGYAG